MGRPSGEGVSEKRAWSSRWLGEKTLTRVHASRNVVLLAGMQLEGRGSQIINGFGRAGAWVWRRRRSWGTWWQISSGGPKKWNAEARSKGVATRSAGLARSGGVVYLNVLGPNVSSSYTSRPREDCLSGDFLSTSVVPQLRTSSSTAGGKSEPARIRQPTVDGALVKRRRPRVTNVEEPPMTLTRGGWLGVRISSMMSMPRDTHEICSGIVVSILNCVVSSWDVTEGRMVSIAR